MKLLSKIKIFNKIYIELGITELLNTIPNLKREIYKLVLFSVLVSFLDLLSLSLIGVFIISIFTGALDDLFLNKFFANFQFSELLLSFSILIIITYFLKAIISYQVLKKIIEFCFKEQTVLRKRFLDLYFSNFETLKGEELNHKVSSVIEYVRKVTESYLAFSLRFISDFIVLLIILVFLSIRNIELTMLLAAVVLISFILYVKIFKQNISLFGKKSNVAYKKIVDKSLFIFGAHKEIKIHNKEKDFIEDFLNASYSYTHAVKSFSLLSNIPRYYAEFIFVVFILLVCVFTIKYFGTNEIAYSIIGVYSAAAARLAPLVNNLTQSVSIIWNSRDAVIKVNKFIIGKKNFVFKDKGIKFENNIIKQDYKKIKIFKIMIKNFNFSYENKEIYKNLNLEIKRDNLVGFYGDSGSGKTTLVNSIIGFLKPEKGKIYILDDNLNEYENLRHNLISFIPQEINLMSENILKNVSFELDENKIDHNKAMRALETSNAKEFVEKLQNGIKTDLYSNGQNLSGGQKQRIAIARAIYNESQILILDEPFSSLDEKSEELLMKTLQNIKKDKIIIIITHKKKISKYFDQILIVDQNNKTIKELKTFSKN